MYSLLQPSKSLHLHCLIPMRYSLCCLFVTRFLACGCFLLFPFFFLFFFLGPKKGNRAVFPPLFAKTGHWKPYQGWLHQTLLKARFLQGWTAKGHISSFAHRERKIFSPLFSPVRMSRRTLPGATCASWAATIVPVGGEPGCLALQRAASSKGGGVSRPNPASPALEPGLCRLARGQGVVSSASPYVSSPSSPPLGGRGGEGRVVGGSALK